MGFTTLAVAAVSKAGLVVASAVPYMPCCFNPAARMPCCFVGNLLMECCKRFLG